MRILVVEDEAKMAALIRRGLREEGIAADVAERGEDALWMAGSTEFDAIVLDVMLPGIDGFETCRRLRDDGIWAPVLMLTARDAVEDRVAGLDHGADDYLVKPFSFAELLARLRALVRRGPVERPVTLEVGELRLDPALHSVSRGATEIALSAKEFALLEAFMRRPGEVLSRYQLLEHAWDYDYENRSNIVDVYIRYLREKIDRPFGDRHDRDRARGRLPAARRRVMLDRLSIRARLTAAFVASLALVLALAGLFVYLRTSSELTAALEDGLDARAADLTTVVESGQDPPRLTGGLFQGEEGFSQILTPDGELVASTLAPRSGAAIDAQTLDRAATGRVFVDLDVPSVEGKARVLAQPVDSADGPVIVVAGSSTDDRREALAGIAGAFLIGAPLALALAGGLGFLFATRALAPVEALRRRAADITLDHSGERLPLPAAEDELHRLAETLNAMLDRIEGSLERERVFVADASHELRTPLAILRAELDLARRPERTPEELREAILSASEEVDRLSRLAEDLLVIARADQGRLPIKREPVEVRDLLERVGSRFAARAREAGRAITRRCAGWS